MRESNYCKCRPVCGLYKALRACFSSFCLSFPSAFHQTVSPTFFSEHHCSLPLLKRVYWYTSTSTNHPVVVVAVVQKMNGTYVTPVFWVWTDVGLMRFPRQTLWMYRLIYEFLELYMTLFSGSGIIFLYLFYLLKNINMFSNFISNGFFFFQNFIKEIFIL